MVLRALLSRPISAEGLGRLKEYKYRGVDHSLIYKLMYPMVIAIANRLPLWIAPNLITLTGLLCMTAAYVLLCGVLSPDLATAAPAWVYVACAVAKFLYQVLDELDGKQARRTASSSPMGELFDHGCDALSCMLTTTTIAAAMQLGAGWWFWALNAAVFGAFYATIWEQLHTDFLELHHLGPNEAHTTYILLMLLTAALGPAFWARPVPLLPALALRHAAVALLLLGTLIDLAINFRRVAPFVRSARDLVRSVRLLAPLPLCAGLSALWCAAEPAVLHAHPQALALGLGFLNSHQVGTLIVSRVTKDPPRPYTLSMLALALAVADALTLRLASPGARVVAFALLAALAWAHFAASTIVQLCHALGVRLLHIPVRDRPVPLTH